MSTVRALSSQLSIYNQTTGRRTGEGRGWTDKCKEADKIFRYKFSDLYSSHNNFKPAMGLSFVSAQQKLDPQGK